MEATKPAVSLLLVLAWCGCTAQVMEQPDSAIYDLAAVDGNGGGDSASVDLTPNDDLSCPMNASEICGNGCDDDRNGYADDDDPACAPQVLATWQGGSAQLERLVLTPPYARGFLDGNAVPVNTRGVYSRAFSPGIAWLVSEGAAMQLVRLTLPAGMSKGAMEAIDLLYAPRDACIFNGELIVVERRGFLHRLQADGKTANGMVQLASWTAANTALTSCASDGKFLYVSEHFGAGPSQFEILDNAFGPTASPVPIPDQLLNAGIDRCLDFAWTQSGFYGLFKNSGGVVSDDVTADQLRSFALDGGVGPLIDAGVLHSLGEFRP